MLRRIASRELVLPLNNHNGSRETGVNSQGASDDLDKQQHYREVNLICVQIPQEIELSHQRLQAGIFKEIERNLLPGADENPKV